MHGAWIRVFRHLERIQKMEERKVRWLIFLNLFLYQTNDSFR